MNASELLENSLSSGVSLVLDPSSVSLECFYDRRENASGCNAKVGECRAGELRGWLLLCSMAGGAHSASTVDL